MKIVCLCAALLITGVLNGCESSPATSGSATTALNNAAPQTNDTGIHTSGTFEAGGSIAR